LRSALIALGVLATSLRVASASCAPSFNLDECAWTASYVVVVAPEGGHGTVRVLESWRGALSPGDAITVPGIDSVLDWAESRQVGVQAREPNGTAPLCSESACVREARRSVLFREGGGRCFGRLLCDEHADTFVRDLIARDICFAVGAAPQNADPVASGRRDRLVLFLDREGDGFRPVGKGWLPYSSPQLEVSMVWIEAGDAFAVFDQGFGSQRLSFVLSERLLRVYVERLTALRRALDEVRSLPRALDRVAPLEHFARNGHLCVADDALQALTECGELAVPSLGRLLADRDVPWPVAHRVAEALGAIATGSAKSELVRRLEDEVVYWKTRGGFGPDERILDKGVNQWHFERARTLLLSLATHPDEKGKTALIEIGSAWRKLPESSGATTMCIPELAERALAALEKR